jgi:carbon monoxide dehydrogenase subunit G
VDLRTYRFSSKFTLEAPRKRVHELLVDLEFYADWWPQVRAVAKIDDDHALVVCRSTLPYDLELELSAVRRDPALLEVGIDGPIRGWARYHLDEQGPGRTSLRFEQEVRAEAPMFVLASYVARPLLVWNHDRMIAGLGQGLRATFGSGQPSAATAAS